MKCSAHHFADTFVRVVQLSIDLKWPILICFEKKTHGVDAFFGFVYFQGRIKKIMQSDEEVGKVAQAVPIIIYILFN